jgi:hypothetical protein
MPAAPLMPPIFLSKIILQKMIVSFYIEAKSPGVLVQRYENKICVPEMPELRFLLVIEKYLYSGDGYVNFLAA